MASVGAMLVIGVLLLVVGVVLAIGGVLVSDGDGVAIYGIGVSPIALFVLGAVCALALAIGIRLALAGTRREVNLRRDQRRLAKQERKDTVQTDRAERPHEGR